MRFSVTVKDKSRIADRTIFQELNVLECGSEKFEQFLNLLGERIKLKGWDKYRGGLDIKGKLNTKTMFTNYNNHVNSTVFHSSR